MADSTEGQKTDSLGPELHNLDEVIEKSTKIEDGTPTRYHVKPRTNKKDDSEPYRKIIFGERDTNKPHKIILMVGETGTGKTKLINTMINYMLGVQREDKVWFEITDDQSDQTSVHSQTSIITVYGFYLQESPIHLTIIDTPGYGDTQGADLDKQIVDSLLYSCNSVEMIHELHTVCLVIKATQTRLSDKQIYIFDAVQSLFGRDIAENIVLLFTYSRGAIPKNVLTAVKEAKIKCAENDENQPVYFMFENCQSEAADEEEDDEILKQSWNLSFRGMEGFFIFLNNIKPKTLKMTQDVLQQRKQLEENISKIHIQISHIQNIEKKQNEPKQTQEDLGQKKEQVKDNTDFEDEVTHKEKGEASAALCCTVCQENCYSGCWWFTPLSWCEVIKNFHCTVCTNKCHYSKHVKGAKIYSKKTKKDQMTKEDGIASEKECNVKIGDGVSSIKKLEEELQELKDNKMKQVMEAVRCVETLEMIALNTDSLKTLQHIDFLIEKLKEINEPEKAETLENIKKRAGEEKQKALGYMKRCVKSEKQNIAQ